MHGIDYGEPWCDAYVDLLAKRYGFHKREEPTKVLATYLKDLIINIMFLLLVESLFLLFTELLVS